MAILGGTHSLCYSNQQKTHLHSRISLFKTFAPELLHWIPDTPPKWSESLECTVEYFTCYVDVQTTTLCSHYTACIWQIIRKHIIGPFNYSFISDFLKVCPLLLCVGLFAANLFQQTWLTNKLRSTRQFNASKICPAKLPLVLLAVNEVKKEISKVKGKICGCHFASNVISRHS